MLVISRLARLFLGIKTNTIWIRPGNSVVSVAVSAVVSVSVVVSVVVLVVLAASAALAAFFAALVVFDAIIVFVAAVAAGVNRSSFLTKTVVA